MIRHTGNGKYLQGKKVENWELKAAEQFSRPDKNYLCFEKRNKNVPFPVSVLHWSRSDLLFIWLYFNYSSSPIQLMAFECWLIQDELSVQNFWQAEAAVVSKIVSGKCSVKLMKVRAVLNVWYCSHWHGNLLGFYLQELGHCLALLPKSRGDEESWSLMMQKILLRINVHLNDAFQGVEEGIFQEFAGKCILHFYWCVQDQMLCFTHCRVKR